MTVDHISMYMTNSTQVLIQVSLPVPPYQQGAKFLTPQGAVKFKNLYLCSKISMFFIKNRTILASIQGKLPRNTKFLTDNQHGSRKSRVLICNINTPLIPQMCCKFESVCSPLLCLNLVLDCSSQFTRFLGITVAFLYAIVHTMLTGTYSIQQFIQYTIVHIVYNSSYSIQ